MRKISALGVIGVLAISVMSVFASNAMDSAVKASRTFDLTVGPKKMGDGTVRLSEMKRLLSVEHRAAYERCRPGSIHGLMLNECTQIPAKTIKRWDVTSAYKIENRCEYARSKMRTGALVGLPVGAAAGALLALLFGLTSSGVLGVAALAAIAGGVAGAIH